MRFIPTWALWVVIIAAAIAGPFLTMLVLIFCGELLWDMADAVGASTVLALAIGLVLGLLLGKSRPRRPLTSAT